MSWKSTLQLAVILTIIGVFSLAILLAYNGNYTGSFFLVVIFFIFSNSVLSRKNV